MAVTVMVATSCADDMDNIIDKKYFMGEWFTYYEDYYGNEYYNNVNISFNDDEIVIHYTNENGEEKYDSKAYIYIPDFISGVEKISETEFLYDESTYRRTKKEIIPKEEEVKKDSTEYLIGIWIQDVKLTNVFDREKNPEHIYGKQTIDTCLVDTVNIKLINDKLIAECVFTSIYPNRVLWERVRYTSEVYQIYYEEKFIGFYVMDDIYGYYQFSFPFTDLRKAEQ